MRKQRRLLLVGPDAASTSTASNGLGDFIELEVVLRDDQSDADGAAIAERLMATSSAWRGGASSHRRRLPSTCCRSRSRMSPSALLLEVERLCASRCKPPRGPADALRGVSFALDRGETSA